MKGGGKMVFQGVQGRGFREQGDDFAGSRIHPSEPRTDGTKPTAWGKSRG